MYKAQAQNKIKQTFENPFEEARFRDFVRNLLKHIEEEDRHPYSGQFIPLAFQSYISTLKRVAKYSDGEHEIDILIVHLKKSTSLERARTAQRNFIARYLNGSHGGKMKDAALVAFVSPDEADWRFSLIKMDYKFVEGKDGKTKVKEEFTPAKRWSFLVGKHENSHTAQSRLAPIVEDDQTNPSLKQLEEAFNIEKVTKEFYEKYKELFWRVKDEIDGLVNKDFKIKSDFANKNVNTVDFSKKLLGQIVFLYFLQKKGWFGVPMNKSWGEGDKKFLRTLFEEAAGKDKNYFNDYLEPLFYEALAKERDDDFYSRFECKIPFLNGGLFDPLNNYDWVNTAIDLPNDIFSNTRKTKDGDTGDGVLDIFDRYNFTVKEDEPLEKEVAVDPEMLGKVFENLLEVKDRKSKGTYYTPREIVHYMCEQSLVNYLATELVGKVSKEDLEKLIKFGENVAEHEAVSVSKEDNPEYNGDYKRLLPDSIKDFASEIDGNLASIKVCDPAIGSGAFPVGMMNAIVKARMVLSSYLKDKNRTLYTFKRDCIQNSLYGVDIDPGAVEIAKLRLWLSLVVDEDNIKQIKPLPNLDYKIMQGNSLLEEFEGIKLFDEKLLAVSDASQNQQLESLKSKQTVLQKEYFELHYQNKLTPIKKVELTGEVQKIQRQLNKMTEANNLPVDKISLFDEHNQAKQKADELKRLHKDFFEATQKSKKDNLKKQIEQLEWELIEATLKEQNKVSALKKLQEFKQSNTKPFFLWKLNFADVFEEKGGFDVVIANPPYVDSERMMIEMPKTRESISDKYITAKGNWDLYIPFWELGFKILNDSGGAVFITPNKWLAIGYGKELRILLRPYIYKIGNCDLIKVFEAGNSPVVVFARKFNRGNIQINKFQTDFKIENGLVVDRSLLNGEVWGFLLSGHLKLILKIKDAPQNINSVYYAENPFTVSEAYEFQNILTDFKTVGYFKNSQYFKFVNTGTIEKYYFLWAVKTTKYLKEKYNIPVVDKKVFQNKFPKRFVQMQEPKLIISGMRNFECALDASGDFVAGKSTVILKSRENEDLIIPLAIFNSTLISFYIKESFSVLGIDGGINFTANLVESLPLPNIKKEITKQITSLTEKILEITKTDDYLKNSEKQAKVHDLEHHIDELVYKLYGLTKEEINIIEKS